MRHQSYRAIIQVFLFLQSILVLFGHTSIFITLTELGILTGGYRGSIWFWTLFIIIFGIYYIWKRILLGISIYTSYLIGMGLIMATYDASVVSIFGLKTIFLFISLGLIIILLIPFFLQKTLQKK